MAVLPILELPHPTLRTRAKKVRTIDSSVLRLAYDMIDTMRDAPGVGLAANQVGDLRRVIVVQLPDEEEARVYINPEIVHREGQREVEEGCLSVPGYKGTITRSVWVRFRAQDQDARVVKLKADDLLAQVLEHEVDHLNGILYLDHLESHEMLIPTDEKAEAGTEDEEAEHGDVRRHGQSGISMPTDEEVQAYGRSVESADDGRETSSSLKIR